MKLTKKILKQLVTEVLNESNNIISKKDYKNIHKQLKSIESIMESIYDEYSEYDGFYPIERGLNDMRKGLVNTKNFTWSKSK